MKQRVIFVGVHNKPGKTPLDSSTLTGRTVDAIAAGLGDEFEIVKSNLYDTEALPPDIFGNRKLWISKWKRRVKYKKSDIVVALGHQVSWDFSRNYNLSKMPVLHIAICHPAKRMSADDRKRYIQEAVGSIKRKAHDTRRI